MRPTVRPTLLLAAAATALIAAIAVMPTRSGAATEATRTSVAPAPPFTGISTWINSPPLALDQLRGKVVLVDFWTYTCVNCLNQLPHVKTWHQKYKDQGLVVVGVHSPEYDGERATAGLRDAVKRLGIQHPVAQDNDFATWNAYGNRFWPALYLIDKQGRVVYRHYGEGRYEETEAEIRRRLAQP